MTAPTTTPCSRCDDTDYDAGLDDWGECGRCVENRDWDARDEPDWAFVA